MRWLDEEQGVCLEFDDPVTWVWLIQLVELLQGQSQVPNLLLEDDLSRQEDWQEWVKPELEAWQNECFEVVKQALELASKQARQLRQVRIKAEQLDAWIEVLGRARLQMEERWKLSAPEPKEQELLEAQQLSSLSQFTEAMPEAEELSSLQRSQMRMRFHFYGILEERLVLKLADLSFPEEDDPLGTEIDE